MTSLCVIGNSHVAALLTAWEDVAADYPKVEAEFFGHRAVYYFDMVASENAVLTCEPPMFRFTPGQPQVRDNSVAITTYDAAVVVGCAFGPACVLRIYLDYHFPALAGRQGDQITRDQFKQAVHQRVRETPVYHVCSVIRGVSPMPLLAVPVPLPNENGFAPAATPIMWAYRDAADNGDGPKLMELYREVCDELRAEGIVVVGQSEETKASEISTRAPFGENAVRLRKQEKGHASDDVFHMNADYGKSMWREVVAALG